MDEEPVFCLLKWTSRIVFRSNNRPHSSAARFLTFRTGSEVVVANAFRLLDVPTTA